MRRWAKKPECTARAAGRRHKDDVSAGHIPMVESETVETVSIGVVKRVVRSTYLLLAASALAVSACASVPTQTATLTPRPIAGGDTATPATTPAVVQGTSTPGGVTAATEAATSTPTPSATSAPVRLSLWQTFDVGSAEDQVLTALVNDYVHRRPGLTVDIQNIPSYQIYNRWQSGVADGTAGDLVLASNDTLGAWVRAGAVAPLDDQLAGQLQEVSQVARESVTVAGQLYGLPGTVQVLALYYRTSAIVTPPATAGDLLALVKGGKRLVLNASNYYSFGFFEAFGGQLMDSSGACTAGQGGFAEAMQFLLDLKSAGASFQTDTTKGPALLASGAADMLIDGPWALAALEQALGGGLGVAPMPAGSSGPARPLARVEGI